MTAPTPLRPPSPLALREARERAELSQERLAAYAWVSPRTIHRIERGLVSPHPTTRHSIRAVLAKRLRDDTLVIDWPTTTAKEAA